jgi:inosine-uridine nucleoside N-ribohydrolase
MMPKPVILDTDMSPDSWLAVLFLLQRSDVDVKAITIAGTGESHRGPGVRNAARLAGLTRRPQVPIAGGRETPLRGNHRFPLLMRWVMDRMLFLSPGAELRRPSAQTAVDLLTSTIESSAQKVTLIAVGGLTNTAEVLQARPTLSNRLEGIYIMGGAVDVPGNIQEIVPKSANQVAEWNIYTDPHAASVVLQSGAPITLVPLDATNRISVSDTFRERLEADQTTAAAQFACSVLHRLHRLSPSRQFYLWDPMTVAVGIDQSLGIFEQRTLRVIEEEGPQSGQTLDSPDGTPVRVCKAIDRERFEQMFLDGINGRL